MMATNPCTLVSALSSTPVVSPTLPLTSSITSTSPSSSSSTAALAAATTTNLTATAALPPEEIGYIPDKVKKAEKRISAYPYDTEAWSVLIRDAQMKMIGDARNTYERLVTQFPNAGRYWKSYIEQEMKAKNYERVEKLFQRCLIKVLNIDLWKLYLSYIKETKGKLPSYREKMAQAYDFALDKVGMDIMSYQIWVDYINFLKSVEAVGSYAENQRITAVRKVYQRGVVNPMINIELLWKDYNQYETNINPLIAKKMSEDRGRDYMNARRVAKEYEAVTRGLNRNSPSVPPQNTPEEAKQVELWKRYIAWEKSNPLRTEDHALITRRVMFAYEQCLLCLGHHPDIWYEAASFLEQSSKLLTEKGDQNAGKIFADEAAAIYERAITTLLKTNMLLYFAYADFEESRMKNDKVHSIYKRLLAIQEIDPTLAYIQYMKFARRAEGIKAARLVFKMARDDTRTRFHVYVSAALTEYYCSKEKTVALRIFELGLKKYGEIPDYVLGYVDFMSHLNEDNNTRVLYERVLSSGQIPPERSSEIWSRFLSFESEVGDLSSILKVEKRRAAATNQLQEFEGKETALLIDRYKYMDLYPCSQMELKALGYRNFSSMHVAQVPSTGECIPRNWNDEEDNRKRPEYPKPDLEQMLPYKPRLLPPSGAHPMPGGVFPPPPAAAHLLTLLPPPNCFHGPFVMIDQFIKHITNVTLPDEPVVIENGMESSKIDPGTLISIEIATGVRKRKAEITTEVGEESDEENSEMLEPPLHDIYRSRQQKRVK
ncbi:cleavage stimulation factor subunit 3-like [Octopus vulgaris]|uniref:Cleavage stimulation factor subunit 3-like n=2 Tax=Octopus TaxID=6643 RepID=A0AA36BGT9_OCTVU|nr:cleavage stimulation factor subunit 3 [Octopus sinensis]CAI9734176.1 cleavage stimulation factor subunit 3-like [Octopus vulgaris]